MIEGFWNWELSLIHCRESRTVQEAANVTVPYCFLSSSGLGLNRAIEVKFSLHVQCFVLLLPVAMTASILVCF